MFGSIPAGDDSLSCSIFLIDGTFNTIHNGINVGIDGIRPGRLVFLFSKIDIAKSSGRPIAIEKLLNPVLTDHHPTLDIIETIEVRSIVDTTIRSSDDFLDCRIIL